MDQSTHIIIDFKPCSAGYSSKLPSSVSGNNLSYKKRQNAMKCPLCNSRKGKRKCQITNGSICSLCCGQTRNEESCQNCSFYLDPRSTRKYSDVPSYSTRQMEDSFELQSYSNVIESALCLFDRETESVIKDPVPIKIIELLLDKYYFKDETIIFENKLIERGFDQVMKAIKKGMSKVPEEEIIKVLGVIHFVAKRRSTGKREYLEIINEYVGPHPNVRILPNFRIGKRIFTDWTR
jgi:hypothetical protein